MITAQDTVRLTIRSMSHSRYRRIAIPAAIGIPAAATSASTNAASLNVANAMTRVTRKAALARRNHLTCCRSTAPDRRNRTNREPTQITPSAAIAGK